MNQDVDKSTQKIRQSQKKKAVKNNLEATAKQSSRKESPNAEITFKKSAKKKTSRRKLNLSKEEETEAVDQTVDLNESVRILRDRNNDISTMEFVKHDLLQLSTSKNLDSKKMPNGKLQRKITSKISPIIVTPKNTPPKLSLTPHRSNKTPKKSPISLDSPKTHSIAVPKLFKSPRKLSLTSTDRNSEENREEKSDSDSHAKKSRKSKNDSLSNNSPSDKNASRSPPRKNKHNSKVFVPKFSKSPKIVLKSPKSKKSKSRKLNSPLSPARKRKSTLQTPTNSPTTPNLNSANSSRIRIKISPLFKGKNLLSIKHRLLNSKLTKTLTASQIEDVLAEPIVLLEKLSPKSLKQKNMVRSSSIRARNNSKVLTPTKKASVDMSFKQNSNPKLRNNSIGKLHVSNTNRISPRIKYNTSIQEKDKSSTPLMSSTPREERMTLMDTSLTSNTSIASVNNTSINTRLRHRNQSNMQLFMDKNTDIKNVSKSSLFDKEINGTSPSRFSHVTKQDTTYEKDNTMEKKQENNKNNTYDLEQPQTLNLQQMIKKRTSTDANLSLRDSAKKTKVRFANVISSRDSGGTRKSINKLNGISSRSSISHNVNAQNRTNIMNSAHKSKKVQTPKSTRSSLSSPFKRLSPRSHGGTPRVHLNRIQITPKTSSVEKKSGNIKPKIALIFYIYSILFYI